MNQSFDVIVIGAGVAGTSTARALARQGRSVALLEQFQIGHSRGSSHGASRIFRFSYPDALYVEMAMEALPLWHDLEEETGEQLLTTLGGLDVGKGIDKNAAALAECGADFELIDGTEAHRRWPLISLPSDEQVLYHPDAGIVAADRAVAAFVRSAVSGGAELLENTKVLDLSVRSDESVELRTSDGVVTAPRIVVTAGAWARGLLGTAGIDLEVTPTRETVAYFRVGGVTPPPLIDWGSGWGSPEIYALPSPGQGLKAGENAAGPQTDPDDQGPPNEESVRRVSEWVAQRYPTADPQPLFTETCLYTNTKDEHFVIEAHGPIVVGSPCSGHGFKFAPLTGKRLADLATS